MSSESGSETSGEVSDRGGEDLRQELAPNVVESADLPLGYQLEGPAEPGADADIPGVLGGPGITVISEEEDEPDNRWSEHPR
jgi:hypothetical protein